MKKTGFIVTLLLCMTLLITGCRNSTSASDSRNASGSSSEDTSKEEDASADDGLKDTVSASDEKTASGNSSESTADTGPGEFSCIADISDYWNNLYKSNEKVLNEYEGLETMVLVSPGMCFITGVQYDVLNIFNEDGRHEGNLMLAGYKGFEEKKGSRITFGYDDVLEEDGFGDASRKGDKKVENGNCDLDTGYYFTDSCTDRAGTIISRSTSEFQKLSDGSMNAIVIEGSTIGYDGQENLKTQYIFMHSGSGELEYAYAEAAFGTDFDLLSLQKNMTKEEAIEMFEAAGATISHSGGIKDGVFVLD